MTWTITPDSVSLHSSQRYTRLELRKGRLSLRHILTWTDTLDSPGKTVVDQFAESVSLSWNRRIFESSDRPTLETP